MNNRWWLLLILVGMINPLLFISKNPLLLATKKIPVSPLPLVFDSPHNFNYWAYTYKMEVTTNKQVKTVFLDNQYINAYPQSFLVEAFYFIIIAGSQIAPEVKETKKYLEEILCHSSLKIYKFIPENEKILKYKLYVFDEHGHQLRFQEHLCQ